jgi:hypothetical protein
MVLGVFAASCASVPVAGTLGEESSLRPMITAVDTAHPPASVWVQLDQPGYAALLLVVPGHSATLLYPPDSLITNQLSAGTHQLTFKIPEILALSDSARNAARATAERARMDSARIRRRTRTTGTGSPSLTPLPAEAPTYLVLLTSLQPLTYRRIVEKTAGVSIPTVELEALNAVAKAIKLTLTAEPRDLGGYYKKVELRPKR